MPNDRRSKAISNENDAAHQPTNLEERHNDTESIKSTSDAIHENVVSETDEFSDQYESTTELIDGANLDAVGLIAASSGFISLDDVELSDQFESTQDLIDANASGGSAEESDAIARSKGFMSLGEEPELALRLEGICKTYRQFPWRVSGVLFNRLNLNKCYANQIYVLYGAAKTGKSTLLKIILNLCKSNDGDIYFYGPHSSDMNSFIGYMPQNLGLEELLTIQETVKFYARLSGLKINDYNKFVSELKDSLTMPNLSVKIRSLQNHQKRILSLYLATLRRPQLLLLDEPTTGCDPVYKHFIWKEIQKLHARKTVTVFITSSEESECLRGDIMGYLFNGRILVEDAPSILLKEYGVASISQLLYCVSVADFHYTRTSRILALGRSKSNSQDSIVSGGFTPSTPYEVTEVVTDLQSQSRTVAQIDAKTRNRKTAYVNFKFDSSYEQAEILQPSCWRRLGTMLLWELTVIFRDILSVLVYAVIPILLLLLYYYSVSSELRDVEIGIVTSRTPNDIHCNTDIAKDTPICRLISMSTSDFKIHLHYFKTHEKAVEYSKSHRLSAILDLHDIDGKIDRRAMRLPTLDLDVSSKLISDKVTSVVQQALQNTRAESNDTPRLSARNLASVTENTFEARRWLGSTTQTEGVSLIWGAFTTVVHFVGVMYGAIPIMRKRSMEIHTRLFRTGVGLAEYQVVHLIVRLIVLVVQNFIMQIVIVFVIVSYYETAVELIGSLVVIMLQTICGFSLGVFFYGLMNETVHIMLTALIIEMMAATISGFLWHRSATTEVIAAISVIVPHNHVATALNCFLFKSSYVHSHEIWPGYVVPLTWTLISYVLYFLIEHLRS